MTYSSFADSLAPGADALSAALSAGRSPEDHAGSATGTEASSDDAHRSSDLRRTPPIWLQQAHWRNSHLLARWLSQHPPLDAPWPSSVNAAWVMEALRSPEGEAIGWGRPELMRRVVDWVARGDPPRPAGAADCCEDLMCLVSFVHGDSRARPTPPEDARIASGLLRIWQSALRESPPVRGLAWALIKCDRHGERDAIVVPLGAIERTSTLQAASFAPRRPDARFAMPLLTSTLPKPLAVFAQASRRRGAASARMASMVDEAKRLGVLDKGAFLALEAPVVHARMLLGPWTGLAPWVRKLTLRDLADVRDIPAELAPWIRVLEVRKEPSQEAVRTLPPLRHALPNLHKVLLAEASRHLVDEATDGLRDFDSFREVSTGSCEAFHRHVTGFSTHGRDVFFAMAATLLDLEEDLQDVEPRVRQALLAVLRDDDLADRCHWAATQVGHLEPMQMLEAMERLIQAQSIGSTS